MYINEHDTECKLCASGCLPANSQCQQKSGVLALSIMLKSLFL